jgi:hypothetical protein
MGGYDVTEIAKLQERAAQLAALDAKLHPPAPKPSIEEEFFGLRERFTDADYEAAGIKPGSEADTLRRTYQLDPATVLLLEQTLQNPASEQAMIAAYLPGATDVLDAVMRRTKHLAEAAQKLPGIEVARLPKAAIDLLLRSLDIQRRSVEDRSR